MPSSSAIKQKAKEFLKNNFSAAFAVGFLALAVQALLLVFTGFIATLCDATVGQTVATVIAAVFGAAAVLFLYLPILLGAVRWFWFSTGGSSVPPAEALHLSTVVLKGQIGYTLGFILTLFGWFLLNLLFFPKLYSVPYFLSVYAVYVREIITHYNKQAALCNQTYFPNYRATL